MKRSSWVLLIAGLLIMLPPLALRAVVEGVDFFTGHRPTVGVFGM